MALRIVTCTHEPGRELCNRCIDLNIAEMIRKEAPHLLRSTGKGLRASSNG